jgi:UDP-2,3-diacylglucosamine pyrophosphatase LpxH
MREHTYFVSDLHLFARHSDAPRYLDAIRGVATGAKVFVLGGDIFDFRWSALSSSPATVEAAVRWLENLAASCPGCHFHYLLGNHDYFRHFIDRLPEVERAFTNFSWHRFYLRLGTSVFLHGDVVDRPTTAESLVRSRSRWLHAKRHGRFRHGVYRLAIRAGLHKPVPYLTHRKRTVARRILLYLRHVGEGPHTGVRNIYFGHTHRGLSNYHYGGLAFHNGGATIKGQRFRIVEAVL